MSKLPTPARISTIIKRSSVPTETDYRAYRPQLREDFFHSCAYCTATELESGGVSFEIDHYEPRTSRSDLEATYSNLMYACEWCNRYKSDLDPPPSARAAGLRYFKADEDEHDEHFASSGIRLSPLTPVGEFSIEYLFLNRQPLRNLRKARQDLMDAESYVAQGILALRNIGLDHLPPRLRTRAQKLKAEAEATGEGLSGAIDKLMREAAASPMLEHDPDAEAAAEARATSLKQLRREHPDLWRGREKKKQAKATKSVRSAPTAKKQK